MLLRDGMKEMMARGRNGVYACLPNSFDNFAMAKNTTDGPNYTGGCPITYHVCTLGD